MRNAQGTFPLEYSLPQCACFFSSISKKVSCNIIHMLDERSWFLSLSWAKSEEVLTHPNIQSLKIGKNSDYCHFLAINGKLWLRM